MNYRISAEISILPFKEKYIIYAPLKHLAMIVNTDAVNILSLIREKKEFDVKGKAVARFLETLIKYNIINGYPDYLPVPVADNPFKPTEVMLLPTFSCNLRCSYCYASAGEKQEEMTWEIAKASLDFIIKNALSKNEKKVELHFHGGGEPTMRWSLLVRAVEYLKKAAHLYNLKTLFGLTTNGILNQNQLKWIKNNLTHVIISLDGLPEIQNKQRPLVNGDESYPFVAASIKYLDHNQLPYVIRSTITKESVNLMDDIVLHFTREFNGRVFHFQPLFECGRCYTSNATAPDAVEFVKTFRSAREIAERFQAKLIFNGTTLGSLTSSHCGITIPNFMILPDGNVTSCMEVSSESDVRSKVFFYGLYDKTAEQFVFDDAKIAYLRTRTVDNISSCKDCFLKWHCAGHCAVKSFQTTQDFFKPDSELCWSNQELQKDHLSALSFDQKVYPREKIQLKVLNS